MYLATIEQFANVAEKKIAMLKSHPFPLWVSAMLAGAYVGFGIILIMTLGHDAEPAVRKLIMGTAFGIALTLVVLAGSDLFTGYTMYFSIAGLRRRVGWRDGLKISLYVWLGNLAGAFLLALIYRFGVGELVQSPDALIQSIAAKKMNGAASELFFRAVLCNWLVCLALWMSARVDSDIARCAVIFWCLFAFIASGFEHSVANMTVFSLALLGPAAEGVSVLGAAHNLLWVSLGNTVGGAVLTGAAYVAIAAADIKPAALTPASNQQPQPERESPQQCN